MNMGIETAYTARIRCRLCSREVSFRVELTPDDVTEALVDEQTRRQARGEGIFQVDLAASFNPGDPNLRYMPTRKPWICSTCAKTIADTFSVDATPRATTEPATTPQLPERV